MTHKIRTRIAPSPTGFLHLGTARTALYSWAFARHYGGEFVLRIEDTDVARSTQDSVDQILASMKWLGLDYDEGPIYQMQRLDRYRGVVDQLIAEGNSVADAVFQGSVRRLRPVLMTASIAALGLVPLLFATGPGSEIQRPLAIVVIGGLVTSTALTLILLPILYRRFGISAEVSLPRDQRSSSWNQLSANSLSSSRQPEPSVSLN